MGIINTVLLSGWFQLMLLTTIFFIYSRRVLRSDMLRGYALGWMVGFFFMFVYSALNPPQSFYFGAFDGKLNFLQVLLASSFGMILGIFLIVGSYAFKTSYVQRALSTAALTGVFVIALFLQVISTPDVRLMVSLFILALGMCVLGAYILLGRQASVVASDVVSDDEDIIVQADGASDNVASVHRSRLDTIRQRVRQRVDRNNVPTNFGNTPQGY